MSENQTKKPRSNPLNSVNHLVKAHKESNDKNYRSPIAHQNNYYRSKKNNENERTNPKPLLECLQPEPLLISKPLDKSSSHRQKRNKPFVSNRRGKYSIP